MTAADTAAAEAELPMPISPMASRSQSSRAAASRAWEKRAANSASDRAGERVKSANGLPTPASSATSLAPTCRAITLEVAAPCRMADNIAEVISCG